VFIGTPKGRNAFFDLWRRSQSEEGWFSMMLKASETGLIPDSELALARRDLSDEQYAQEFECSFDAAIVGAYYGKLMAQAEADKRIARVPYEPSALGASHPQGLEDGSEMENRFDAYIAELNGLEIAGYPANYYQLLEIAADILTTLKLSLEDQA
jgi:hypothetical protein